MKLELKHLAGYLPYGLKFYEPQYNQTHNIVGVIEDEIWAKESNGDAYSWCISDLDTKPILRPLSDLTKEIEVDGKKFVPIDIIRMSNYIKIDKYGIVTDGSEQYGIQWLSYSTMQQLLEWHFDIYGLIENNLAIDINTINNDN